MAAFWTPADVAALRRLVRADMTDKAIARRLNRDPKAVEAKRRRLGLRKQGRVRRAVLWMLRRGWPVATIARVVGRHAQHVRWLRREAAAV